MLSEDINVFLPATLILHGKSFREKGLDGVLADLPLLSNALETSPPSSFLNPHAVVVTVLTVPG